VRSRGFGMRAWWFLPAFCSDAAGFTLRNAGVDGDARLPLEVGRPALLSLYCRNGRVPVPVQVSS
jgi:hypothetical protein